MNLYIWRHNKTYHSHSMINEPCVVNEFYLDALAIVEAETLDDALELLEERKEGWRVDLILCRPLLLLPPIPPSIRVFSNESTLWKKP